MKYGKNGLIRFIGHRDTARTLLLAVRRSGVEGVYSQGFSPRLRLSFGSPLPLGFTSDCEYVDIKLARKYEPQTIMKKLQVQLPRGLDVKEVQILEGNPPPLQTAFRGVEYHVEVPPGCAVRLDQVNRLEPTETPTRGESAATPDETRISGGDRVLRVTREKKNDHKEVLSVLVRHDATGGGRVKDVIASLLGIESKDVEKLRIHKARAYTERENVFGAKLPPSTPDV